MNDTSPRGELRELLLVGSLPLPTVEDVFKAVGAAIGPWLSSMPDGEVGERLSWTGYLADHVYSVCPELERVSQPGYDTQEHAPEHGHHWDAAKIDLSQFDTFRIREGVGRLSFGDLYAGKVAVDSYERFRELRSQSVIPEHVRFQVCLPGPTSAIEEFFIDPADWPRVREAYVVAVVEEIDRMLEVIPCEDLTIQFDCAWEIVDLSIGEAPLFPWSPPRSMHEKQRTHIEGLSAVIESVPDDIVVGVHWCYGTWGGWPMNEMEDLELCVLLTEATLEATQRQIDYVHMPVAESADSAFFSSLRQLRDVPCKVYLGLLHHSDGMAGFDRRWELAREFLPDAGVAGVCGFGRSDPEMVPEMLRLHRGAARALSPAS